MRYLMFLGFLGVIFACQEQTSASKSVAKSAPEKAPETKGIMTKHGYRFVNHTNTNGLKPQPGDAPLIRTYTWIGDMLDSSMRKTNGPYVYALLDSTKYKGKFPALYDALLLMGKGDSASIYEELSAHHAELLNEKYSELRTDIVLLDITSEGRFIRGIKKK